MNFQINATEGKTAENSYIRNSLISRYLLAFEHNNVYKTCSEMNSLGNQRNFDYDSWGSEPPVSVKGGKRYANLFYQRYTP